MSRASMAKKTREKVIQHMVMCVLPSTSAVTMPAGLNRSLRSLRAAFANPTDGALIHTRYYVAAIKIDSSCYLFLS